MADVRSMVKEIRENLAQHSGSLKDESRVMKEMLNDTNYNVVTYGKGGAEGTICPAQNARDLAASIINGAADIPKQEAQSLASNYEFTKNDAQNFIDISKEFVNTYTDTERKLSFGGRETYEMALLKSDVAASEKSYPKKRLDESGQPVFKVDESGNQVFKENGAPEYEFDHPTKIIPAHTTVKAFASCPSWLY